MGATSKSTTAPGSLEHAIRIACEAHAGQRDKAGAPYILHPLRVMQAMDTETARIVAILHDVVEDGKDWSLDRLMREGFGPDVIDAVDCLTKRAEEKTDYQAFILRVSRNAIAARVKLADLEDNLDITRLPALTSMDVERLNKYLHARHVLRLPLRPPAGAQSPRDDAPLRHQDG